MELGGLSDLGADGMGGGGGAGIALTKGLKPIWPVATFPSVAPSWSFSL